MKLKSLLATFATVFGLGIAGLFFVRGMISRNQNALERLREEEKMEIYQSSVKTGKEMRPKSSKKTRVIWRDYRRLTGQRFPKDR